MKFTKSIKTLTIGLAVCAVGIMVTKYIISRDKWLYKRISTFNDSNQLIEKRWVDLDGRWYCSKEDSSNYSNEGVNDRSWNTDRFLYIALIRNSKKTTWLRKHFMAPKTLPNNNLILRLSLFDIQSQVFVNGIKVADSCFIYNRTVCCIIPSNSLKPGKSNLIALKAHPMVANPSNTFSRFKDEIITVLQPTIPLDGKWKFSKGDSMIWKEKMFNDSDFTTIQVPDKWENQGYKDYDGFGWYRRSFTVDKGMLNKKLLFIAGKIDDYSEVFINGTKIGGRIITMKNNIDTDWDTYCIYPFNGNLLTGTNTVAIRVLDNQDWGGIYENPIGIMEMDNYMKFIESKY